MSDLQRLKAEYDAARDRLKALNDSPERQAAAKQERLAADAFYKAEKLDEGRLIVERLVGQTIVAVRNAYSSEEAIVSFDTRRLDSGIVIELANGVEIEAEARGEDSDALLRVSEAYKTPARSATE